MRANRAKLVLKNGVHRRLGETASGPRTGRSRVRRDNVDPCPARTFELVFGGVCDAIALKDTLLGTYARRAVDAALGTATR